jgi:adenylate cyclase
MNAASSLSLPTAKPFPAPAFPRISLGWWQYKQALNLTLAATCIGFLYVVFSDGFDDIVPFINGGLIGFLGGIGVSAGELVLFKSIRKRISFIGIVCLKSGSYTAMMSFLIFMEILVSRSIQYDMTLAKTVKSDLFHHFLFHEDFFIIIFYAMLFISVLIFTREISRKMGQGVLFNFITGRYFKPKQEKRIFMFLDLDSSSSIAETLSDLDYHNLLNDFFHDITECIVNAKGQIHHYVGDEVVVSWPLNNQTRTEYCIEAYQNSVAKIQSLKDRYQSRYGFMPRFKAAFHCGDVIYGEIGEIKSEIVFHGDVMNTTARLERMCSELKESVLVSKSLYSMFPSDVQHLFQTAGNIALRGKKDTLEVYALKAKSPLR